jgi:hypothetical protein
MLAAMLLPGCVSDFTRHRMELGTLYAGGRYDQAAATLDDPKIHDLYGSRNELLWKMDRGAVALALKQDDTAISLLNEAENTVEVNQHKSTGDVIGQWLLNDNAAKYIAEPYEDLYLNVIKILAQLQAGRIDGGATVEARRMGGKADRLRDIYLKYEDAVNTKAGGSVAGGSSVVSVNNAGQFIESPLGTYLSAVTFMKSGDREFQRVAGKRLVDSIRLQQGLIGAVNGEDFKDLEERDPDSVNLLVVALSGRGPTKYAQRIGPIPLGTVPVYFELPYLQTYPSEVTAAHLEVDTEGAVQAGGSLALVEDLSAVATENHKRMLPAIYARTLVRYAVKAGISVGLTEAARRRAHDQDQGWVQLAGVVAGLAVLGATEQADLRAWTFLPGQARVGLLKLTPGHHRVRVVYQGSGGGTVYASEWRDIDVSESGLTSVVAHYWR